MTEIIHDSANRAVVAVIAGLTVAQAEDISKAIMVAKDTHAPNGRGTIATGRENNIARMLGDGHNTNLPQQKKKKKKKSNKKSEKNKAPKNKSHNH